MLRDCRGLAVSGGNRAALDHVDAACELFAGYYVDPVAELDTAIELAPDMTIAHCLRAGLFALATDKALEPEIARSLEAATALAAKGGANDREKGYIGGIRAWLAGDFTLAGERFGRIVIDHPRDLTALQFAHQCDFFTGRSSLLRDRVARALPHWSHDVDGYGYVLGMHAFGLEEMNMFGLAEATGRAALELNPRDPWAVHAVAHVMEMQGRAEDGVKWLRARTHDWSRDCMLSAHNWWHMALFHLEREEYDQVLALYDQGIRPAATGVVLEMVDGSAMLWRLYLRGIHAGDRWQRLADEWQPFAEQGHYAFNDVHAIIAFLGASRVDDIERTLSTMQAATTKPGENARMTREVGLPLARALCDFVGGHYSGVVKALLPVREKAALFGGSNAQRDLINVTLLEAAVRSGDHALARALAAERLAMKPDNPWNRAALRRAA